jgi:tRNA (guanosine-2'-O-)-methyltransferase
MRADSPDVFEVHGPPQLQHPAELVIRALSGIVTPERLKRIEDVVSGRTDDLAVVLDGVADPHNVSAVLRSADAFGVQTVHAITGDMGFLASKGVSKGTHRWLDVHQYDTAEPCLRRLKADGFEIFAASMEATQTPEDLGNKERVAIVFGNEHRGVSEDVRAQVDGTFAIPMRGFVESLNVSVAAAITIRALRQKMGRALSPSRELELKARFLMNSVKNADQVIEESVVHGDA